MKRYALYDLYETETEPGELICTSDDYAEIRAAARERTKETDGECTLYIIVYCRKQNLHILRYRVECQRQGQV